MFESVGKPHALTQWVSVTATRDFFRAQCDGNVWGKLTHFSSVVAISMRSQFHCSAIGYKCTRISQDGIHKGSNILVLKKKKHFQRLIEGDGENSNSQLCVIVMQKFL